MRIHALESSGGLTYAEMGRYVSASDPTDPAGTNDEAAALKDEGDRPVNVSYMATGIAIFSIVVGIALILAGVGFLLLASAVFRGASLETKAA